MRVGGHWPHGGGVGNGTLGEPVLDGSKHGAERLGCPPQGHLSFSCFSDYKKNSTCSW